MPRKSLSCNTEARLILLNCKSWFMFYDNPIYYAQTFFNMWMEALHALWTEEHTEEISEVKLIANFTEKDRNLKALFTTKTFSFSYRAYTSIS